jgi:WD40 repeat protein
MTKVFISYSRKDKSQAQKLTEALARSELETWVDWEDIPPTADWMEQIHKGIESADAFLFLLSPDSIQSEVCGQEVDHAVLNGKRLIPIVAQDVNPKEIHSALAKVNWIYLREQDDFEIAIAKTLSAIHTDLAWVETHKRLQVRALEWSKRKDKSLLLRGKDLREAEETLASVGQKDPLPTDLQRLFLLASRRAEIRTRNVLLTIGAVIMVALVLLSGFAINQRNVATDNASTAIANQNLAQTAQADAEFSKATAVGEANFRATAQAESEAQTKLARGGELAVQSILLRDSRLDLALLFSVEAFRSANTSRAKNVLIENTQVNPHLIHFFHLDKNVVCVAFSPDLKVFVAGSQDGSLTVWDLESYQVVGQPIRGTVAPNTIAFSPNGKTIAVNYSDGTLILWDLTTRQQLGQIMPGDINGERHITFSPDGKTLAVGDKNGMIVFWEVATLKSIGQVNNGEPAFLAFSPDGETLAAGWRRVRLWDLATFQPIGDPLYSDSPYLNSLSFSADGKFLVTGNAYSSIVIWDLAQNPPISQAIIVPDDEEGQGAVFSVEVNPVEPIFVAGGTGNTVILWNLSTGEMLGQPLRGHTNGVKLVSFSQDGKKFASYGDDKTVILWEVNPHQPLAQTLLEQGEALHDLTFLPNGKLLAARFSDQTIYAWDVTAPQPVARQFAPPSIPFSMTSFSPAGKIFATDTQNGIILFDIATAQAIGQPLSAKTDYATSLAFSPDGQILASGFGDGSLMFWNVTTQQPLGQPLVKQTDIITRLVFSPDGKFLASTAGNTIVLWESLTTQPTGHPLEGASTDTGSLAFSPDGKTLVSDSVFAIDLWETATRKLTDQIKLPDNSSSVSALAFSPDGETLAATIFSKNGVFKGIYLWDLATRQVITGLFAEQSVETLVFSPDKMFFTTQDRSGTVLLWNLETPFLLEQTCWRAGRNLTRAEWAQYLPHEPYRATCPQWPLEPEIISTP